MKKVVRCCFGLIAVFAAAVLLAAVQGQAIAAQPFGEHPHTLTFATFVDKPDYAIATIVNNDGQPRAYEMPTIYSDTNFGTTYGGTCRNAYVGLGMPVPAHTSCTMEIGFLSTYPR